MTTDSERIQSTPLSTVDAWFESLTDEQVALLRRHKDSQDLPLLVLALVQTGPLSPMQISDANGQTIAPMPPAIGQALG